MRVFLDTNVLVSAYATRGLCADVLRVVLAEHELIVSEVVLVELERVLTTKLRLPGDVVAELIRSLRENPVEPKPDRIPDHLPIRDPDDRWVLASAVSAGADILITGDPDLLDAAGDITGVQVVNPRGFWTMLRGA